MLAQGIIAMGRRLLLVECRKFAVCLIGYTQKFIQPCMYGLGVSMFGPLDKWVMTHVATVAALCRLNSCGLFRAYDPIRLRISPSDVITDHMFL
jgi:hypothetical protein